MSLNSIKICAVNLTTTKNWNVNDNGWLLLPAKLLLFEFLTHITEIQYLEVNNTSALSIA